jgi:hypothetical protein
MIGGQGTIADFAVLATGTHEVSKLLGYPPARRQARKLCTSRRGRRRGHHLAEDSESRHSSPRIRLSTGQ